MNSRNYNVGKAQAYRWGAMSSLGDAANMLMRQFNFPDQVNQEDELITADSDRILGRDYNHFRAVLAKYVGTGEGAIGSWVRREFKSGMEPTDQVVMDFIKDALKAEEEYPGVVWTGWRITGTVNRSNGFPIYTLSLFSNKSGVEVYSDELAPNVEKAITGYGIFLRPPSDCVPDWMLVNNRNEPWRRKGRKNR